MRSLESWKRHFSYHIEEARLAVMPDDERDELIAYLKEEVERIFYCPYDPPPEPPPPHPEHDNCPAGPWWDR